MFCRRQLGELAGRIDDFYRAGAQVVAVSVDPAEESLKFAQEYGISFPLLSDPGMGTIQAYGVADAGRDIAVPSIFLVGQDGTILWTHVGESIASRPSAETLLEIFSRTVK
jgi:peroxiredoxin